MKWLPLITLLLTVTTWAKTPLDSRLPREQISLDNLLEGCTVIGETAYGMVPHFDCETYIYGVLDSYQALNDALPADRKVCLPDKLAPWQVYEELLARDNDDRETNAAAVIVTMLTDKYRCQP